MKRKSPKVKREHHILKEFDEFIEDLASNDLVDRMIPGRITRKQGGSSHESVSFSYITPSGCKLLMKKGSTVQELFVIFDDSVRLSVKALLIELRVTGVQ